MLVNHNIDFCVHGEDLTFDEDGNDSYQAVKDAGKFKLIKRTEGVSTTDIVGRILLLSKEHLRTREGQEEPGEDVRAVTSPFTRISKFVATSRKIVQFSEGRLPKSMDKIVYVDGSFDLYHAGHAEFFRLAKEMGNYLLVGIYSDEIINKSKGSNFPINNLHERVLNVLSCHYVDEVIMDAPVVVTPELIRMMHISKVVHGVVHDVVKFKDVDDPYVVPKEMGIFEVIDSPYCYLSTDGVIGRILENYRLYSARNRRKESKEVINTERMTRLGVKVEAPDEV
jgi:ethanolamine-phosphate cytidylyltransferase